VNRILCALLGVLAYISVHEGGHALAALATGRTVTDVTIFSLTPHVNLTGHSTAAEDAFAAAAGSGMVVALWLAYMLLRPGRRHTLVGDGAGFFAGIELLAWFASSATHSIAPPQNDVTKFITYSGIHPGVVAVVVACVAIGAACLYFQAAICCWVRQCSVPNPNTRSTA
jgi:hypothetical protein